MREHVFVVRIWREYREIEGETPGFRGMIQHAVTGEKQYFDDIGSIAAFLAMRLGLAEGTDENKQLLARFWEEKKQRPSSHSTKESGAQDGTL